MEKSQNLGSVGEQWMFFLEYLLPRLLPNYRISIPHETQFESETHPDIKSALDKLECQASSLVRLCDPDLGVHQQPMVQIRNPFLDARRAIVHLLSLLAFPPLQPVNSKQEAVLGLHDVFLGFVSPQSAELHKVGRIPYRRRNSCLKLVAWPCTSVRLTYTSSCFRPCSAPVTRSGGICFETLGKID